MQDRGVAPCQFPGWRNETNVRAVVKIYGIDLGLE